MSRLWHVEHRDGREWDSFELNELAARSRMRNGYRLPYCRGNRILCVDMDGNPLLIDGLGTWSYVDAEREDMVVVWDE